jgi:hypothetical protein
MSKINRVLLRVSRWLLRAATVGVTGLGIGVVMPFGGEAIAAEQVILKYGPMRAPLSVAELVTFAETGEMSPSVASYIGLAKQNPEEMRAGLTNSIEVSARFLDRALNHTGELLLDEIGEVIQTASGEANGQALRAALILSAAEDGKISILETIQNYPGQVVEVQVDTLARIYKKLSFLQKLSL